MTHAEAVELVSTVFTDPEIGWEEEEEVLRRVDRQGAAALARAVLMVDTHESKQAGRLGGKHPDTDRAAYVALVRRYADIVKKRTETEKMQRTFTRP